MMDRFNWMKSFVRTVEMGSFSAVAREQGTTQPTISKQIAALEAHLDVQLLTRTTRTVKLTEAGSRFYEHCQQVLAVLAEAEASVGQRQVPSGLLRVSCPVAFGQLQIMPHLQSFFDRYPEIEIELIMSDRFVDLVEDGIDVAIRIGQLQDHSLIFHRIGMTRRITVGSIDYFARRGEPQSPADLVNHQCIVFTPLMTGNEWLFQSSQGEIKVMVHGKFCTNNSIAIREAVLAGLGVAVSPIWLFGDVMNQNLLKVVLHDYQPPTLPIHAIYRRGRFQSAKVLALIDFLREEFKIDPWVSDYGQSLF